MPISTPEVLCSSGSGASISPASRSQRLTTPLRPSSTSQA
jgi:hypothetical protein